MEQFSITNKCSHCYESIVLLVKVSELPNASSILIVLAETMAGWGEGERVCLCVCVFV